MMMKSWKRMQSNNKNWGFYGTARRNFKIHETVMDRIFDVLGRTIMQTFNVTEEQSLVFLDSKYGTHFADEMAFYGAKTGLTESELLRVIDETIEESQWAKMETQSEVMCAS